MIILLIFRIALFHSMGREGRRTRLQQLRKEEKRMRCDGCMQDMGTLLGPKSQVMKFSGFGHLDKRLLLSAYNTIQEWLIYIQVYRFSGVLIKTLAILKCLCTSITTQCSFGASFVLYLEKR